MREPEGDGRAERFVRTLKGNLPRVRRVATVEGLRLALQASKETCDRTWTIGRHGYGTPAQVRSDQLDQVPVAARARIGVSQPETGTRSSRFWRIIADLPCLGSAARARSPHAAAMAASPHVRPGAIAAP